MVVGFTTDVCVEVAIVATTSDSGLTGKDLSISLTLNHLFMGALVLFLSTAFLGTGVFHSEVDVPNQWVLLHGWVPSLASNSR